jgi:hypothetical protein
MFESVKERPLASLFFTLALLCVLVLCANPGHSEASQLRQTGLIPWAYMPLVVQIAPPPLPIIEITYVYLPPVIPPAAYEYVQINNLGNSAQVMTDWRLTDSDENVFDFPNFTLHPGRYVQVHSRQGDDTDEKLYWDRTSPWPVWRSGDTAYLYNEIGELIDMYPVP